MKRKHVLVVGGGASGMTAAIFAARSGVDVTIVEQKDRVGKKILSTGNGRCNYTNEEMDVRYFRGEDLDIVPRVLARFGVKETLAFFGELGIVPKKKQGLYYPKSKQASAILDVLRMELSRLHVRIWTETKVEKAIYRNNGFQATLLRDGERETITCDRLILATGGKAAPVLGSDGSGYALAKQFGHTIAPVVPALVQLRSKEIRFKEVAGVRTEAKVTAYVNGKPYGTDTGELQLTDYGLSGIPIFQISRHIALGIHEKKEAVVEVDFLPDLSKEEIPSFWNERLLFGAEKTMEQFLVGLFNKKLALFLLKQAGIRPDVRAGRLTKQERDRFLGYCKGLRVRIEKTNSFEQAQVCAGGVRTKEVDGNTMESRFVKGLYFTGELLDIEGMCGGYNLQWAWATGAIAGSYAARGEERTGA